MIEIHTYRLYRSRNARPHWWSQTWQAEFEGIMWATRAWTERGARRSAMRLAQRTPEQLMARARRNQWVRMYVTCRSDPYYAELRQRPAEDRPYRRECVA